MRSNAWMLVRAVVMLLCLVAVPLAALLGTALPSGLRDKLAGPAPRMQSRPAVPRAPSPRSPRENATVPLPANSRPDAGSNPNRLATTIQPPADSSRNVPPPAQPQRAPTLPSAPAPGSTAANDPSANVRLLELFQRLQDLGAKNYRLERSEQDGGRYYFQCLIDGLPQPIMASDTDVVRTAERVVREVEAYRATRFR